MRRSHAFITAVTAVRRSPDRRWTARTLAADTGCALRTARQYLTDMSAAGLVDQFEFFDGYEYRWRAGAVTPELDRLAGPARTGR